MEDDGMLHPIDPPNCAPLQTAQDSLYKHFIYKSMLSLSFRFINS